jgi:AraC-like DNA-binding protein
MNSIRIRDGFKGEKLITLPETILNNALKNDPIFGQLYLTSIGYFPKAAFHYRHRSDGCEDNILIYCLRGKGWYIVDGVRFDVLANQFFIIPATTKEMFYGADEQDPWTINWIHFSGKDMTVVNHSFNINLFDGPRPILLNEKGLQLWENMYNTLEMGYSKQNLAYVNMCLYYFVATFLYPDKHLNEKKQDEKDMINNTILFMRDKLEEQLTVQDFAARNNFSVPHFSSLFQKATGMSPIEYFIHLKLQKACLLLYSTDIRIKNVSAAIGYDDPYYFSRLFKKYMNVSPDQYRHMRRKKVEEKG